MSEFQMDRKSLFESVMEHCELFVGKRLLFQLGENKLEGTIDRLVPVNTVNGFRPGMIVDDLQMTIEVAPWRSARDILLHEDAPNQKPRLEKQKCRGQRVLRPDKIGEGEFSIEGLRLDDFETLKDTILDDLMMADLRQNEKCDELTKGMRLFFVRLVQESSEFANYVPEDWVDAVELVEPEAFAFESVI